MNGSIPSLAEFFVMKLFCLMLILFSYLISLLLLETSSSFNTLAEQDNS